ncbi:ribosome silencing factor [Peptoniphilus sp.]|jgi:ribosome-associated protein|uniref:ribosome silencing factor n=1 Tax=Peptoniphilus sp. TaxID=1971214 RepID=UPI003D8B75BA
MDNKKLDIIVDSCESKKGIDIKVLDIKGMTSIADYFVIVSGNSSTQVSALADEIEDKMAKEGYELENTEGKNSSRWILLDFGDIIVHVFHKDEREYYNLERLWTKDEDEYELKEED